MHMVDKEGISHPIYDVLAGTYDAQFAPISRREWCLGIIPLLQQAQLDHGFVIDIGCGTGVGAELLSTLGSFTVDGVDCSTPMLTIAQRKSLYRKTFLEVFPPLSCDDEIYDLACCGFDTLNCLHPEQYPEFFHCVRNLLKPTGSFVFDTLVPGENKSAETFETTLTHLASTRQPFLHMHHTFGATSCLIKVVAKMPDGSNSVAQQSLSYVHDEDQLRLLLENTGFLVEQLIHFLPLPAVPPRKLAFLCHRS